MKGILVRRSELGPAERRQMFALLARHFEGIEPAQFARDLDEKDWVVLALDATRELVGFSTLLVERRSWRGTPLTVVSSGDTIMAPEAWKSPVLSRTWIESVRRIHAARPHGRLVWLLLASGFRSYRFLPVFWREFFPRFDAPTPERTQALLHELARARYGSRFDASAGVVRFDKPQVLRAPLRSVPAGRRRDPHVAFFLAANPGHERGDELVCLTELAEENLTDAGRRMVEGGALAERRS